MSTAGFDDEQEGEDDSADDVDADESGEDEDELSAEDEYYQSRERFDRYIANWLPAIRSSTWSGTSDRFYGHAKHAFSVLVSRGKRLSDVPELVKKWDLHTSVYPLLERSIEYREHTAEVTLVAAAAHVLLQYRLILGGIRAIYGARDEEERQRKQIEMRLRYAWIERHAGTMDRATLYLRIRALERASGTPPLSSEGLERASSPKQSRAGLRLGPIAQAYAAAVREDKLRDAIKRHILTHEYAMSMRPDGTRKLSWDAYDCASYLYPLQEQCGIAKPYALTTLIERLSPLIKPYR